MVTNDIAATAAAVLRLHGDAAFDRQMSLAQALAWSAIPAAAGLAMREASTSDTH